VPAIIKTHTDPGGKREVLSFYYDSFFFPFDSRGSLLIIKVYRFFLYSINIYFEYTETRMYEFYMEFFFTSADFLSSTWSSSLVHYYHYFFHRSLFFIFVSKNNVCVQISPPSPQFSPFSSRRLQGKQAKALRKYQM
jgi:hypothetical protein